MVVEWSGHSTIFQVEHQRYPASKTLIQGLGYSRTLGHKRAADGAVLIELPFDEHFMTLRWPAINLKDYARFIRELLQ